MYKRYQKEEKRHQNKRHDLNPLEMEKVRCPQIFSILPSFFLSASPTSILLLIFIFFITCVISIIMISPFHPIIGAIYNIWSV